VPAIASPPSSQLRGAAAFPLSLRRVEGTLAACGIISHENVRQWARKFGQSFANPIEPSAQGSWKIADAIVSLATEHSFGRARSETFTS
jgi:transposase-like protein